MNKFVPKDLLISLESFKELSHMPVNAGCNGILVAISGGSDSMGLLRLAKIALPKITIVAGFIDHGLRDGTWEEWLLVEKEAQKLGIIAVRIKIASDKIKNAGKKEGLQQWARNLRYELLQNIAISHNCTIIATGHTLDDQAETVMMRILRGAGVDGLGAIPNIRYLSDSKITIIRPLLGVTRNSIKKWLERLNVVWASDPSNKNLKYARVKIRNEILVSLKEINNGVSNHLAALAKESVLLADYFDNELIKKGAFKKLNMFGGIKILKSLFLNYDKQLHSRIVRMALKIVKGDLRRIERVHLDSIVMALLKKRGTLKCEVPGDTAVYVAYGNLYIFANKPYNCVYDEKPQLKEKLLSIKLKKLKVTAILKDGLNGYKLRLVKDGDTVLNSSKKLSRLLSNKKIPSFYRGLIPVIVDNKNKVISAPFNILGKKSSKNISWNIDSDSPLNDIL